MDTTVVLRKIDNAPNPYVDGAFDDRADAAKSVCDYFLNDADGKMSPVEAIDLMISLMRGHHARCERRSVEFWLDTIPLNSGASWTGRNAKKVDSNSDVEDGEQKLMDFHIMRMEDDDEENTPLVFSAEKYNEADRVVCSFTNRAFEVCHLFKDELFKDFWNWVSFNHFEVIGKVADKVCTCFELVPDKGWAYVSFPTVLMNMDDDEILDKYKAGEVEAELRIDNPLTFKIAKKEEWK